MAAIQPPISAPSHFIPRFSNTTSTKPTHIMAPLTKPTTKNPSFCWNPTWFNKPIYPVRVADQSSNLVGDEQSEELLMSVDQIKQEIYHILKDVNRGIFGVPSEKKTYIESLVKLLESQNPTPHPTSNLDKVGGCWKLIYSTITILGSKRTKLGLRDFISLGDFFQTIDIVKRVDISYENSSIVPDQIGSCETGLNWTINLEVLSALAAEKARPFVDGVMADLWWPLLGVAIPVVIMTRAIRANKNNVDGSLGSGQHKTNEERFICERVCTTKKMQKGMNRKHPIPETCITVCNTSQVDACSDACARAVCATHRHQLLCVRRCNSECLKLSADRSS
ncbi:hypothetical protein ACFE04_014880 [Oxalis oulophora]